MSMRLSICIPTFNRADFIGDTLENISKQLVNGVEVIIVDGASSDHTEEVVRSWLSHYPAIKYYRGKTNCGVDADLAKCLEIASGEYCWLMSSDDFLYDGAIEHILREIDHKTASIYLGNRIDCTKDMTPIRLQTWIEEQRSDRVFVFNGISDIVAYFENIKTIGALFSYIPCVIVARVPWLEVHGSEPFYGTNYAHVYRLLEIIVGGGRLKYINKPVVLCRMDNDSFSSQGLAKRYLIDFQGYLRIAHGVFQDNQRAVAAMLAVITREHRWPRILKVRADCQTNEEWETIRVLLVAFGYRTSLIAVCGFFGRFRPLVFFLHYVYHHLLKQLTHDKLI